MGKAEKDRKRKYREGSPLAASLEVLEEHQHVRILRKAGQRGEPVDSRCHSNPNLKSNLCSSKTNKRNLEKERKTFPRRAHPKTEEKPDNCFFLQKQVPDNQATWVFHGSQSGAIQKYVFWGWLVVNLVQGSSNPSQGQGSKHLHFPNFKDVVGGSRSGVAIMSMVVSINFIFNCTAVKNKKFLRNSLLVVANTASCFLLAEFFPGTMEPECQAGKICMGNVYFLILPC